MHEYRVGQPYSATRRTWPEINEYNYRGGAHELRMFVANPTAGEVEAVRSGKAEFGLYVGAGGDVLALLYRFSRPNASVGWGDAPFSIHILPEEERIVPTLDLTAESRALLSIILVNAAGGTIMAQRAVSFSPGFTRTLHEAIAAQAARPFSAALYDAAVNLYQARYPDPRDMLRQAVARCTGGE